jgi:hypothetical protein
VVSLNQADTRPLEAAVTPATYSSCTRAASPPQPQITALPLLLVEAGTAATAAAPTAYKRRPRRPPFLRVESVGMGVTSSAQQQQQLELEYVVLLTNFEHKRANDTLIVP